MMMMLTQLQAAKGEFYRRTGQLPERLLVRPEMRLKILAEVPVSELSIGFAAGDIEVCGMKLEQRSDLKAPFEVR